jgi:hypothetical protein
MLNVTAKNKRFKQFVRTMSLVIQINERVDTQKLATAANQV